jgi:predicted phage-related endonuclease
MPDPERLTLSSTQSPALWGASPYITRWMLYRYFKGDALAAAESARMEWGTVLQPLVLAKARDHLGIEVTPNFSNHYVRHAHEPLGSTVDALAIDPQRGPGVVEVKCVFDYGVWMREWQGGKSVPRHHEIQLQHHMAVGDGSHAYDWGCFAVWVCADMHYFARERDPKMTDALAGEARVFFQQLANNEEPDPFGEPIEAELLQHCFPTVPEEVLDLRSDPKAHAWADHVRMLEDFREKERFYKSAALKARMEFMSVTKSAGKVLLPGAVVEIKQIPVKGFAVKDHTQQRLNISLQAFDDEITRAENPFA